MTKVSVIIPHFNRSDCMNRCLQSVLHQTLSDWECWIIDDGSSVEHIESLTALCRTLNDPRLHLILLAQNRGGGSARNVGIDHANGEFVAFLDSDDEWLPEKLEKQIGRLESTPGTYASCLSEVRHKEGTYILPHQLPAAEGTVSRYLFVRNGWLPTPALVIRRNELGDIRFREDLPRHQDYDLLISMEKRGLKPLVIQETLVIVHWETLDSSMRGINIPNSKKFLEIHRTSFDRESLSCFRAKFIAIPTIRTKGRAPGLTQILACGLSFLRNRNLALEVLSFLVFRDRRMLTWVAKTSQHLASH